jgi:hypothetical protein
MEGTPPYLVLLRHSVRMDDICTGVVQQGGDGECKTGQDTCSNNNDNDAEIPPWPDQLSRRWDTPISDYINCPKWCWTTLPSSTAIIIDLCRNLHVSVSPLSSNGGRCRGSFEHGSDLDAVSRTGRKLCIELVALGGWMMGKWMVKRQQAIYCRTKPAQKPFLGPVTE